MRITASAVDDFRAIFARQGYTAQEARAQLERDLPDAKPQRTKANGAQVLRAAGTRDRYYLLVHQGRVVAVGPPSANYPPGPSYERWAAKPGEQGPAWWSPQDGDTEAPRPTEEAPATTRAQVLPVVAEARLLCEQAGVDQAEVAQRLGAGDKRRVRRLWRGDTDPTPAEQEALAGLVRDLRRQLGLARGPGRPRKTEELMVRAPGFRLPESVAAWVAEQGGSGFLQDLVTREYNRAQK